MEDRTNLKDATPRACDNPATGSCEPREAQARRRDCHIVEVYCRCAELLGIRPTEAAAAFTEGEAKKIVSTVAKAAERSAEPLTYAQTAGRVERPKPGRYVMDVATGKSELVGEPAAPLETPRAVRVRTPWHGGKCFTIVVISPDAEARPEDRRSVRDRADWYASALRNVLGPGVPVGVHPLDVDRDSPYCPPPGD